MGYKKILLTCWEKERQVFNKSLLILTRSIDKKAVHDIRVAVKKLKAISRLYELITENKLPENVLKKTDEFFSTLGRQRDIEICLELTSAFQKETNDKYAELKRHFRSVLDITYKWTKKAVKDYKKKELLTITLLLRSNKLSIPKEDIEHKIASIIADHLLDCKKYYKQPHKLRQHLKEIYYWLQMAPEDLQIEFSYERDLQKVLDDFGNWQNLRVFETRVKHFRKDYLPDAFDEYEGTKSLKDTLKEKSEKLLKEALAKTNHILKKVSGNKNKKSEA